MPRIVDSNGGRKGGRDRKSVVAVFTASESEKTDSPAREIKNGCSGNIARRKRVLDPRMLSFINRIVEKNVSQNVQQNQYFSNLSGDDQKPASSISTMDGEQTNRKIVSKDGSPSSPEPDPETSGSSKSADRRLSSDRIVKRRVEGDDDLREVLERRSDAEDLRSKSPRKVEDGGSRIVLNSACRSASKRFRVAHESNSPEKVDSSSPIASTPPRRKSEVVTLRRQPRRISDSESESNEDDKKKIVVSSEPSRSRREKSGLRRRSQKSDGQQALATPSRWLDSDRGERFTFFFTKKYPFSNHYQCQLTIDGKTFNCTEQYYMYKKAVHFGDLATAELILAATDPKEIKKLGKSSNIKDFKEDEWDREDVGRRYMLEANLAKYHQNPRLRAHLLNTHGTTLVEANPTDSKWGIGLSMDSPLSKARRTWRGQNWLGEILTKIRDELMDSSANGDSGS